MTDSRESKYFSTYQDYNKTLRAWFVAFGAGGPALLAVEPDLRDVLVEKNVLMTVVVYFLAGTRKRGRDTKKGDTKKGTGPFNTSNGPVPFCLIQANYVEDKQRGHCTSFQAPNYWRFVSAIVPYQTDK